MSRTIVRALQLFAQQTFRDSAWRGVNVRVSVCDAAQLLELCGCALLCGAVHSSKQQHTATRDTSLWHVVTRGSALGRPTLRGDAQRRPALRAVAWPRVTTRDHACNIVH